MSKAKSIKTRPIAKSNNAKKPAAGVAAKAVPVTGTAESPSLDQCSGAAALGRVQARLLAVTAERPLIIRFNVRMGAAAGLGLVQLISERGLRPSYEALAQAGFFDLAHLDGLADLAQALWYVRHRLDEQAALRSRALLPAALVQEATGRRRRMLRVLDFRCADHAAITTRLDYIRSGTGYQDLADDLMQLAALYDQEKAALADMPEPYDAQDQEHAAQQAVAILNTMGLGPELETSGERAKAEPYNFSDLQRRAAMLLERSYEEVAAAGRFICRSDDALVARFAPLSSIARSRPTRSAKADPDAPDADAAAVPA